jgi:hypothetical protein
MGDLSAKNAISSFISLSESFKLKTEEHSVGKVKQCAQISKLHLKQT